MRQFHIGLLSIIELHFEDVEAYLAGDFAQMASEEVWPLPSGLACCTDGQCKHFGEMQGISLAPMVRAGPVRRASLH